MIQHCQSWSDATETVSPAGLRRRQIDGHGARLVRVVIPGGTRVPRHSHSHEQFVQILSGTGTLDTDRGRTAFGPGSVLHFGPDEPHAAEFDTETVLVEMTLLA